MSENKDVIKPENASNPSTINYIVEMNTGKGYIAIPLLDKNKIRGYYKVIEVPLRIKNGKI